MYHKQYREFCFGLSIVTKYFDIDQFQYTISSLQLIYIYIYININTYLTLIFAHH